MNVVESVLLNELINNNISTAIERGYNKNDSIHSSEKSLNTPKTKKKKRETQKTRLLSVSV